MKIPVFLLFLFSLACHAQAPLTGIIRDSRNNTPLPFASIVLENGSAVMGDVDGRFIIEQPAGSAYFTVSYTGYKPKKVSINPKENFYPVAMEPRTELLGEVVITAGNPANAIIREAIRRKKSNDPQLKLSSFRYKAYERLIVTANPDSISGKLDSIFLYEKAGRRFEKIDSSGFKFKKLIKEQHLYQTEKVSEYSFNKGQGVKEKVLATRMAGFKQPLYEFIGLTLQSQSVYGKNTELLETNYAGPVADDALSDYHYKLLDTVNIDNRSVYMVHFSPKHRKKKKLQGILYIDRNNYGIARAVFRVRNVLDITSTHFFTYEKEQGIWFPDRKILKIIKGNNKDDIKILGETIKFDAVDNDTPNREKQPSDYMYLLSESRNFDREYNIPISIKRPDVAIEIGEAAIKRDENYWNSFRTDTLDTRSLNTYIVLDSIVAKENWEQRIFLGRKIINGYLPLGPFDLDLRHLIKYNNYEGFRLGAGGTTNDRFSELLRVSGYGAYGTRDGRFKYNIGAAVRVGNFSNSWIGGSYTDDVKEIASTSFATDKRVFKIYDPRPINITTFYNHQTWQLYISTKILPKTESFWQVTQNRIDPKFAYVFNPGDDNYTLFNITTASASIQWNPGSDFMQTPEGRIEVEKRFPKFAIQYTQSVAGVLDSDFTFGKLDFRAEYEKKYLNGQTTSLLLQTGVAVGDTPLTHLYSTSPNNLDRDGVLKRITLAGKNSFETMYFNEFFSSQYVIVQMKHSLRKFTLVDKIKLSPVFVTRAAWGNMENRDHHSGIEYNTLQKGYYESGFELNEIFWGFGFTAFYRYGPYHLPQFDRNISIKLSFVLNLF